MDKTIDEMMYELFLGEIIKGVNAVINVKVDNGVCTSKIKGNLAGIVLACADIVHTGCKQANKDPKDVLEKVGQLIDIMDEQKNINAEED